MSSHDRLNLSFSDLLESSPVHQIWMNLAEDCEVTLYHENCWECFSNFNQGVSLIENAELKPVSFWGNGGGTEDYGGKGNFTDCWVAFGSRNCQWHSYIHRFQNLPGQDEVLVMNQERREWVEGMTRRINLRNVRWWILTKSHEKIWGLKREGRKDGNGWEEKQCPIVTGKIGKWDGKWQCVTNERKWGHEVERRW
jgi:hypothetical protein